MNHKTEGPPCRRMEASLQQAAEGKITGIKKLYVLAHAAQCYRCGTFLERMRATLAALKSQRLDVPSDALDRLREKYGGRE
ncbi:MAG: hypothetical protein H7Y17_15520 [Chlorobia bacterium]|nr:hypothetical protein [Fimbriimonadaceae bacterium]